jgi:hypothetical protein
MPVEAPMSRFARAAVLGVFLLSLARLSAAEPRFFDRVDFSITLKDLAAVAAGEKPLPQGRLLVLDGTVTSLSFLDKEEASFRVRAELMSGEWIGLEDVRAYTCVVTFSGSEWFTVFPARPPRNPPPGVVLPNSRVIIVARPLGVISQPGGPKVVSLEGLALRLLR